LNRIGDPTEEKECLVRIRRSLAEWIPAKSDERIDEVEETPR
jgi:hypothetical protein